jgi:hypothetical protein
MVGSSTEVRSWSLGHPAIARARMMAIVTMVTKKSDCTDMLTRGLAEPYRGLSILVKEGGVPANFH